MGEWIYRSTFSCPRHYLEMSGQLHAPARFTLGERAPGTHWIGGWVDARTGLDDLERRKFLTLPGLELRPISCPARSSRYTDYATPAPGLTTVFSRKASGKEMLTSISGCKDAKIRAA
jgi:hypothetical protein